MGKDLNMPESISDLRGRFSDLKTLVDTHQSRIDNLKLKVDKIKIYGYETLTYWMFVAFEIIICLGGVLSVANKGYPWWTSLSFVYLIAIVFLGTYNRTLRNEEYLNKIKYDAATYWNDEYNRLLRSRRFKKRIRTYLFMMPVFIHTVFVAIYLHSISELGINGKYWWLILLIALTILLVSSKILFNKYCKTILDLFRQDD